MGHGSKNYVRIGDLRLFQTWLNRTKPFSDFKRMNAQASVCVFFVVKKIKVLPVWFHAHQSLWVYHMLI